jgi:hypothetical protein
MEKTLKQMNDIGKIRIELSKMNCRVHMKLPDITRSGDELIYHTCCDDFKQKLESRFSELINEMPVKKSMYK